MSAASPAPSRRALWWGCAAAVAAGGALRVAGGFSDFWLDEVWTWDIARRLHSWVEVFTRVHDSNNNHLNTLLVYALGDQAHWIVYRIPSLLAGTATIALAAWVAARRGRLEALLAALLTASCFSLLHFSSEARGYALAVAFALGAHEALQRFLVRPRARTAAAFGLCALLGTLSHLVWLFYWAGAAAQSAWRLAREGGTVGRAAARLAALHALPLAALAALWWVDLRQLQVGGGNPTDALQLLARVVGFSFGLPVWRALALPYGLAVAALVAWGVARRRREGDDAWIAFAVTIALAPALVLSALRPEVVALRYFLIGIAFALLLGADLLAAGLRAGGAARAVAVALLALFVAGNAWHTARFLRYGRGGYSAAVRTMAELTEGPLIRVGSDHDFRNGMVLRFYGRLLPPGKQLVYYGRASWPRGGPDWLVLHRAQREPMPRHLRDARGDAYRFVADFDHAAISGFYWALYRREPAATGG